MNPYLIITAAISASIFTIIFLWIFEKIDFCLWWRKWKRFIDKQYDDAKEEGN